ncbi:heat shock cognate 70 kda protein 1 [Hordeum vulgare]|nr:heat shock cognate 70 kda protein 1 [Hordeum vulgare]
MEACRPDGLWLRANGCCNGPVWVAVDLAPGSTMFLMRVWKSFARSRVIGPRHLLHFRFDDSTTLFVKFFGASGVRLECCVQSSSGSNADTSGDSDNDRSILASSRRVTTPSSTVGAMEGSEKHGPVLLGRVQINYRILVADRLPGAGGDAIGSRSLT